MQEQNGVAYCASTFSKEGSPPRTVFAAQAYVPVTISDDDLSLQRLYDHPDFIDLISAQEFGLEQTGHGKLLLCVVVAAAPGALRELMGMITSDVTLLPCAQCRECDNSLRLSIGDAQFSVPMYEQAGTFLSAMLEAALPLEAMLTALTTWCTGYGCQFFREADQ